MNKCCATLSQANFLYAGNQASAGDLKTARTRPALVARPRRRGDQMSGCADIPYGQWHRENERQGKTDERGSFYFCTM
jgi:hypothetical protein